MGGTSAHAFASAAFAHPTQAAEIIAELFPYKKPVAFWRNPVI